MKNLKNLFALAGIGLMLINQSAAQGTTGFHVLRDIPITSTGGWDYITVDGANKRIYASHGNQVNVLSTTTGDSIGYIPKTTGVHGIALAKPFGKGYVSNGRANTVTVFDIKTMKVLSEVPLGTAKNPDAIFYDDFSKKIITCNGTSKDATFFDPA